jgi:hypothetical protein
VVFIDFDLLSKVLLLIMDAWPILQRPDLVLLVLVVTPVIKPQGRRRPSASR